MPVMVDPGSGSLIAQYGTLAISASLPLASAVHLAVAPTPLAGSSSANRTANEEPSDHQFELSRKSSSLIKCRKPLNTLQC